MTRFAFMIFLFLINFDLSNFYMNRKVLFEARFVKRRLYIFKNIYLATKKEIRKKISYGMNMVTLTSTGKKFKFTGRDP